MCKILEVTETTAETRERLSKLTDKALFEVLMSVDKSIKAGFEHAIYYQEWSVGVDILYKRGYGYLVPSEIEKIYNNNWR